MLGAFCHEASLVYTVWSRGKALATTDLGFIYRPGCFRCGWLHPTAMGERYLPIAAGVAPALRAEYLLGPDPTLRADVLAASDQEEALELELRREDGSVIETTHIAVIDTEYLLSIPISTDLDDEMGELSPEDEAEIAELVAEIKEEERWSASLEPEKPPEFPRFQLQVELVNPFDVP